MEIALVLIFLLVSIWLFVTEKFPIDLVAIMILGSLLVISLIAEATHWIDPAKWISPQEGISGFSNSAVITVAAMFVLSAGLQKTGAVRTVGRIIVRLGNKRFFLLVVLIVTVSAVSAFLNNTATVAVFLPLILAVSSLHKISPSKLLIPLSFASQFGGVCTVIGSSTNLIVSSISQEAGLGQFAMFEMGKLGLILVMAGLLYMIVIGQFLLPDRRGQRLTESYQLGEYITELRVLSESPIIGKTVRDSGIGKRFDVTVLEILRKDEKIFSPLREPIQEDDVLLVRGKVENLMDMKSNQKLGMEPEFKFRDERLETGEVALAEVVVAARSSVEGKTLSDLAFRNRYKAIVLAIHRRGHALRGQLSTAKLQLGDALLLMSQRDDLAQLRGGPDFVVLDDVDDPSLHRRKVPLALGILFLVVMIAAMGVMPIVVSAILGCIALIATRCITLEDAYTAINWSVIFLLAGILPLGIAIEKTGCATLVAETLINLIGQFGPVALLAVTYGLTALLTELISNNASAVLIAPIMISVAHQLGVNPKPFLMAVAFAASTSFATPVGYHTNAMVYNPGGYKFTDYPKVGIPLILIFWGISVYFIPKFWPF